MKKVLTAVLFTFLASAFTTAWAQNTPTTTLNITTFVGGQINGCGGYWLTLQSPNQAQLLIDTNQPSRGSCTERGNIVLNVTLDAPGTRRSATLPSTEITHIPLRRTDTITTPQYSLRIETTYGHGRVTSQSVFLDITTNAGQTWSVPLSPVLEIVYR